MTNQYFGTRLIIPTLNFGASGLTNTIDFIAQMKSYGTLQGLYLFLDAVAGSAYTNALDLSGNGNTAVARTTGGYQTPLGSASGVSVPQGGTIATSGVVYDTPVAIDNTNGFTRIWAGAQGIASVPVATNGYVSLTGSKKGYPSTPANFSPGTGTNQRGPLQEMIIQAGTPLEAWLLLDTTAAYFPATVEGQHSFTTPEQFHINSMRINIPSLTYSSDFENAVSGVHNGALQSAAGTQTFTDTHSFGIANGTNTNSDALPAGTISAFALYDGALSDANNAAAISTIQKIMEMRGISI